MSDYTPPEVLEFDDLATMDVLSNPIRLKLLDVLSEPATVKEAAEALDVPATRLYHHVNQMLDHGLLVVVEERPKGAMTERVFGVGGRSIRPSAVFRERFGSEGQAEVVRLAFRMAETQMTAPIADGEAGSELLGGDADLRQASIALVTLRLDGEDLHALIEELDELVQRYGKKEYDGRRGSIPVGFFHAVYPRDTPR
ncbi:MAG: helix-turn-helix domain-containing protein [Acidimicrobiia bacterium]